MPDDILSKVITFISGSEGEQNDDRSILLKQLAKEVPHNKYARMYRVRQEEADPSLAMYFYSLYKVLYHSRIFFKKPGVMAKLKQVALESYLDKPVMDVIKRLSPEAITERRKTARADFPEELEKDLQSLTIGFSSPRLAAADRCFSLILHFQRFVSYDYFAMLKKFAHDLQDGYFTPPKFIPVGTDTIMADLANFLSVLPPLDYDNDWRTVFEILKYCNGGVALLPYESWPGLLADLKDLEQSRILETIVRLASKNPIWEAKPVPLPDEQLTADWLEEKTGQVRKIINTIAENQKNAKIAALEREIFAASDINRLSFYTKERGKILTQKGVDTYLYASALNHLAAFIEDFVSKEMAELSDLLLVRGQWTNNADSIAMSEAYHTILEVVPSINDMDHSLSDEGNHGPRLRGALLRMERDHTQTRYITSIVDEIDEETSEIINRALPSFLVLAKYLSWLVDDCQKKDYEHIMNWKELIQASKTPMAQRLDEDSKKVNCFIQLMYLEAKVENEEEEEDEDEEE